MGWARCLRGRGGGAAVPQWHWCAMLLGAGLCGVGRAHAAAGAAACAGPGRAVAGGVRWGGSGVCASGVGARPCRGPALQGFGR